MITWLASYPRSGNTLLRTLLNSCFELQAYDAESDPESGTPPHFPALACEVIGIRETEMRWEDFYPGLNAAAEMGDLKPEAQHQLLKRFD